MDSHCMIKITLSNSLKNGNSESLCHLTSIRTQEMETYDLLILIFLAYNFSIAILSSIPVHIPFKWFVDTTICHYILLTKLFLSIFLTITAATILDWCEYCSWHKFVTHHPCLRSKQSFCQ